MTWIFSGGDRSVKFRRDQHDIQKSIDFYSTPVYLERDSFITLSTFSWQAAGNLYPYQALEELASQAGVPQRQNISWPDFADILRDSAYRQITLFAQADSNGLIFAGERVSFERVAQELEALDHAKGLISIISDKRGGIQELFANSGKVRRVVFSGCDYRDAASVGYATEHLREAYRIFGRTAELSPRQFEEIRSNYGGIDINGIIGDKMAETEGKVTIKVGQLTQKQKKSLTFGLMDALKNYIQGPSQDYNTSIEELVEKDIEAKTTRLKQDTKLDARSLMRSMPFLKALNVPGRLEENPFYAPRFTPLRYG